MQANAVIQLINWITVPAMDYCTSFISNMTTLLLTSGLTFPNLFVCLHLL